MLGTYHLTVLYDILNDLHFLYDSDKIYAFLLENIMKAMDADAASLFIADSKQGSLFLRACIGPKKSQLELVAEELPFPYGKGVCGWVAKFNQPIVIDNVQADQRFNPQVDTLTGYKTKSVLCVPISNMDEVLGVIEILNKKSAAFNKNDQDLVALIAKQAAIAMENGRLYTELKAAKNFSESVLANLISGFIAVDAEGTVTHMNAPAEKILLLSAQDCLGHKFSEAFKSYSLINGEVIGCLKDKETKNRKEMSLGRSDKTVIHLGYSTFPVLDGEKVLGASIIFKDMTGLK
jgi:PAS domain S-box-containing protein